MKVLVTPPGKETRYPRFIRMIMYLPIGRYSRWRLRAAAISRLKPVLLTIYNLPKQMPEDFEFTYDYQVFKDREPKRLTITTSAFSADQKQNLYNALRNLGFIHFETNQNIEVSYDFIVQTDYKVICRGREYSYSWSTIEPTRSEWSEEEVELDELINKISGEFIEKH